MLIEVSVPGIRKERGKLPAPTTLGALKLAVPLEAGPPICGQLIGSSLCGPVTGTEVGVPVAAEHPVNTEKIKGKTIRLRQWASSRQPPLSVSDRGALLRRRGLRGIELPITLLDAASPLVPGNDDADMVRASALAGSGDFLLRLAVCQGKDLFTEGRRGALAASWFCGRRARAPG